LHAAFWSHQVAPYHALPEAHLTFGTAAMRSFSMSALALAARQLMNIWSLADLASAEAFSLVANYTAADPYF